MINIYKNCDECKFRKKSYTEEPCKNCMVKNTNGYIKKNWKPKNPLVWFLAFMED